MLPLSVEVFSSHSEEKSCPTTTLLQQYEMEAIAHISMPQSQMRNSRNSRGDRTQHLSREKSREQNG